MSNIKDEKLSKTAEYFQQDKNFNHNIVIEEYGPLHDAFPPGELEELPIETIEVGYHGPKLFLTPSWFTTMYTELFTQFCLDEQEEVLALRQLLKYPSLRRIIKSYIYFVPEEETKLRPIIDIVLNHNEL